MSNLSFMGKLLGGAEVEWKALGDLVTLRRGRVMSKEYLADNNGIYPVYSSQTANNGEIGKIDTFDFDGEYISWTTDGANAGTVFYRKGKFSTTNVCGLIKINDELKLNYKYLFYWLSTEAQKHVYSGMGNPKLMSHQVEKIPVPIPCPENPKKSLEIQAEIVRILDAFTAHTAELTAELTARKKQYNYYRDKLLSFEEGEVEWRMLSAIATFSQGIQVDVSNQFPEKPENFVRFLRIVDFVKSDEIPRYIKNPGQRYLKEDGELVMIRYGASAAGKVYLNHSGAIANNMFKINLTTELITTKFLHAYLSLPSIYSNLNSNGGTSTMPAITFGQIGAVNIPIPPLEEQARILAILDKFDALTNSITEGLPREIELRQKQYEYYRDLLLSFSKSQEVAA